MEEIQNAYIYVECWYFWSCGKQIAGCQERKCHFLWLALQGMDGVHGPETVRCGFLVPPQFVPLFFPIHSPHTISRNSACITTLLTGYCVFLPLLQKLQKQQLVLVIILFHTESLVHSIFSDSVSRMLWVKWLLHVEAPKPPVNRRGWIQSPRY